MKYPIDFYFFVVMNGYEAQERAYLTHRGGSTLQRSNAGLWTRSVAEFHAKRLRDGGVMAEVVNQAGERME